MRQAVALCDADGTQRQTAAEHIHLRQEVAGLDSEGFKRLAAAESI